MTKDYIANSVPLHYSTRRKLLAAIVDPRICLQLLRVLQRVAYLFYVIYINLYTIHSTSKKDRSMLVFNEN